CRLSCRDHINRHCVSSSLGNNRRRGPYQRLIVEVGHLRRQLTEFLAAAACAPLISPLHAWPALQGCSPWMLLAAWRASMDRCRRPPEASLFPISPLAPSI